MELCYNACNEKMYLIKCTSSYPAPIDEANMAKILKFAARFGVLGFSDHTLGSTVSIVATTLGAKIIEKHFTLGCSIGGSDASFSMDEKEFTAMVKAVREAEQAVGQISYELTEKQRKSKDFCCSLYLDNDIKKQEVLTEENGGVLGQGSGCIRRDYMKLWTEE